MVKPERTAIDRMVEADALVLARPSPDNPFAYGVTEVLLGAGTDAAIPDLVDARSRRLFATNADAAAIYARGADGTWQRVALLNDGFRPVLTAVLTHRQDWRAGTEETRYALVERLQHSPDRALQSLVIAELDRIPYATLRTMDLRIPTKQLLSDLWTKQGYSYQAIRVLLLGLSKDPDAREAITSYVARAAEWPNARNLGAYAAALIELDGTEGVEMLSDHVMSDVYQPLDKVEQVLTALAEHNLVGEPPVRDAISAAVSELIDARPEASALVARQFSARSDWSQAPVLLAAVRARQVPTKSDLLTVSAYLSNAKQAAGGTEPSLKPGWMR